MIEFPSAIDPGVLEQLGQGVLWQDGSSGSYDFTPANSYEAAQIAYVVTNGTDDLLNMLALSPVSGGGGPGNTEFGWGFGNPDLAGNQIDFVRLVVHDLSIEPYILPPPFGDGLQWDAHITWEFWGTPVPEPAASGVLAGVGCLCCRRLPSRRFNP